MQLQFQMSATEEVPNLTHSHVSYWKLKKIRPIDNKSKLKIHLREKQEIKKIAYMMKLIIYGPSTWLYRSQFLY